MPVDTVLPDSVSRFNRWTNQNDPFIQCMIGESYEKLGEKDKATEYYRKASTASSHNPPAAYAVPFAKRKLT